MVTYVTNLSLKLAHGRLNFLIIIIIIIIITEFDMLQTARKILTFTSADGSK